MYFNAHNINIPEKKLTLTKKLECLKYKIKRKILKLV